MKIRLNNSTILFTVGAMIPKLMVFLLLPFYTHYLVPEEYGIVTTVNAIYSFLLVFMGLGYQSSTPRLYYEKNNNDYKVRIIGESFTIVSISSLLLMILLLIFDQQIGGIVFSKIPLSPYYYLLIIYSLSFSFQIVFQSLLRLEDKGKIYLKISILQALLLLLTNLTFVFFIEASAVSIILANIVATVIITIISIVYMFPYVKFYLKNRFEYKETFEHLKFTTPFVFHILSWSIFSVSDRIVIEKYDTLNNLGIYSLGAQITAVLMIVATSINQAINPKFFEMNAKLGYLKKDFMDKSILGSTIFLGVGAIVISKSINYVIKIVSSDQYNYDYEFVNFLLISILFHNLYMYFAFPFFQRKKSLSLTIITFSSAILNIILNIIFINIGDFELIALSTMISKGIMVLVILIYSKDEFSGYKLPLMKITLLLTLIIILILI
ncbi:oligosaccharide flippase family protein [Rossellomorea oryzaecorticis]|uniref:Oligosaccharide flippase family protein n=1 Tax=Rossellomorea oryzaecorticis TaxID=1396505 RepID=A0ABU9K4T8_9BACI